VEMGLSLEMGSVVVSFCEGDKWRMDLHVAVALSFRFADG
jgi:hypothetical protein